MQCIQCKHENALDAKFCNQCATPFVPQCSSCRCENAADAKFCNQCGTSLTANIADRNSSPYLNRRAESESRFHDLALAVAGLLQRDRRVTYRTLKYVFEVDDGLLSEIREELLLRQVAIDEGGTVLVWTGTPPITAYPVATVPNQPASLTSAVAPSQPAPVEATAVPSPAIPAPPSRVTSTAPPINGPSAVVGDLPTDVSPDASVAVPALARSTPEAERRQLTVMFCDLADSTTLSQQLDPEDLREVVRAYQATVAEVIHQSEGHMAQYLGDGLLIYFGWPQAHEDDAQRALHSGLGIVEAITTTLNPRLEQEKGVQLTVRLGVHTGMVVVGEMGGGGRHENLATGETVNIASRLEGLAVPNTVLISHVTARLVQGGFELADLGPHELKGVAEPMPVFRVDGPIEAHEDETIVVGVPFLVGRDEEMGLLLRRWEQSKEGLGQVVLLSGEAGIGKSSLAATVRHHVVQAGYTRITFRCSPYHTNSALYPVIAQVQRVLQFQPDDTPATRLDKLEGVLTGYSRPLEEVVPLYAAFLSVPVPEGRYAALHLSPQQQRQQTQDVLVSWMLEEAERQPTLAMWEDLHWADPSTLEMLGLVLAQTPTVPMLHVLTSRPEFESPWPTRSHMTPITLNRLERPQVEALIAHLAGGKTLPVDVVTHIVGKTDGVPLYVEELTKMLLESDLLQEEAEQYVLTGPLLTVAIPETLQDSLMARLDQMHTAKEVAQLGAVLGREFPYEMLQAISSQDEETVQAGLTQLVEAELLYQRGRPPRASYIFKHALIQDAAYQSLLRSTRQQHHQRIAQVLAAQFPEVVETQPELVAHHYTEAACHPQAVAYWQRSGQRAVQRSAYAEAHRHLTQGLALLDALPDSPERAGTELGLRTTLGPVLMATKGQAGSDVEHNYARARELCQQVGDTPQLFPVIWGLWRVYNVGGQFHIARDLGEQLLALAQRTDHATHRLAAHHALGFTLVPVGEYVLAREHFEQVRADYDRELHRALIAICAQDSGVTCLGFDAWALWALGKPEQAIQRSQEAISLARELSHPLSLGWALLSASTVRQFRCEVETTMELSESAIALSTEHGFPAWRAYGTILHGWALAAQGHTEEGIEQIQQGLSLFQNMNFGALQTYCPALLADAYRQAGQVTEAFRLLSEALAVADRTGEGFYVAELHRLQGELLLHAVCDMQMADCTPEDCFQRALDVARSQQAKSWELRAAMSLARLWQSQDKRQDATDLLAPVYHWFTEGFDTADLQEAKALLAALEG